MTYTNFSGIQELFYDNINSRLQSDLKGFITYALNSYDEKYISFESTETMEFCFHGDVNPKMRLNLIVSKTDSHPDLSSLTISGVSDNSKLLLQNLKGRLDIEYDNELLKNIDENLYLFNFKNKSSNKKIPTLKTGLLNMYLLYNKDNEPCITHGKLERVLPVINKAYKELRLEDLTLDNSTFALLQKAPHIFVNNTMYRDNNPDNELFFETCHIYNLSEKESVWKYNIRANSGFLPIELLPNMTKIFNLIADNFTNKAFHRVQVNNLSKDWYSGDTDGG